MAPHPPKVEYFDLESGTNTDPKGHVRAVTQYHRTAFGLFLVRPVVEHPQIAAFQSWLLPELGLRVTDWAFHPGHERDQDFYVDLVEVEVGPARWRVEDHYVDLVVRTGRDVDVLDTDELLDAVAHGLLEPACADRALRRSFALVEGLAGNGCDLPRWLADRGAPLTWADWPALETHL